jgi:FG-GAP repeat
MVEMRRITVMLALILVAGVWPAAPAVGHAATAAQPTATGVQADFNNDGAADLAVGVPGEDVGSISDAGAVNVLYGSAAKLTGTGSQIFTQDTPGVGSSAEVGDFFGDALATGDFNNDGFTDLAVGVPGESVGTIQAAGAVNVLYGSASGLTGIGSQIFTQVGSAPEPGDEFGFALAAGDFNHDGFADLAAGAPFESAGSTPGVGAVSVLYGSAAKLTTSGGQIFTQVGSAPEPFDAFAFALAAGDFNNDGFADLAAGAPFESAGSTPFVGAVSVLYGSAAKLTKTGGQIFTQVGSAPEPGDAFAFALAAGDFNNDGFADLAAGAPFEDAGSTPDVGAVSVLYGSAAKLTKTGGQIFTQNSPGIPSSAEPGDLLGIALATGDPHASTVAAAPSAPGSSAQRMASTR